MRKHGFDPVALLFGVVFTAAGLIVITGGTLYEEGAYLVPLGLIGLGIALFKPGRREPRDPSRTP